MQLQYVYKKELFMLRITRDVVIRVNLLNLLPSVAALHAPSMSAGSALSPLDLPCLRPAFTLLKHSYTHILYPVAQVDCSRWMNVGQACL